jgi:hypothetical protein
MFSRISQSEQLGMCGWVIGRFALVATRSDNQTIDHNDRADGDLTGSGRLSRLFECQPNHGVVVHGETIPL